MNLSTLSQEEAGRVKAVKGDCLISICTPDTKQTHFPMPDLSNWEGLPICQVKFHDAIPRNGSAEGAILMTTNDAKKIVLFVRENQDCERLVIHCMAGRSRSNSVARYIHERWKDLDLLMQPFLGRCDDRDQMNKWVWYQLNKALLQLYFEEQFFITNRREDE